MIIRRPWFQLVFVLAVAFFARAVVFHFLGFEIIKYTEFGFDMPAQHWLLGEDMGIAAYCPTSYRAPGFILYLIGLYGLFGRSAVALGVGQIIWGMLVVLGVYIVGRRVFSHAVGIGAAAFWALYPYAIYHDITGFYFSAIFSCLLLIFTGVLFEAARRGSYVMAFMAGIVSGVGLLFRGTLLIALPFAAIWLAFYGYGGRRRALGLVALMICGTILVLMPWWIRNYEVHGQFVFLTTDGGRALWKSMNTQSLPMLLDNGHIDDTPDPYDMPSAPPMAYKDAVGCGYMSMSEPDQDTWYYRKVAVFALSRPWEVIILAWHKFLGYWSIFYFPPMETGGWSYRYSSFFFGLSYAAYTLAYAPLLFFALFGFVRAVRQKPREALLLCLIIVGVSAPHLFFAGYTKYRLPLDPFLALFAAYGLIDIVGRFFPKRI